MRIEVVPGNALSQAHIERWREIQDNNDNLASPYFCPEFTQAVADVRDDVYVAIIEVGGDIAGFFPFQRSRFGAGQPVGGNLSDFHGIIAEQHLAIEPDKLLKDAGLAYWDFHHLALDQDLFSTGLQRTDQSHYIDLSRGYDAYEQWLTERGSKLVKDCRAKRRRLERESGAVEFVSHVMNGKLLERLFSWKSKQYNAAGLIDLFDFPWTRELLERIHAVQNEHFGGMLSVLYAGGEPVAIHMGMRSKQVWNWWFPRHDETYSKCSPGIILRMLAAETASGMGMKRIDLGFGGGDTYKPRLANGSVELGIGRIERPSFATAARRAWDTSESLMRTTPIYHIARLPGKLVKRWELRRRLE